MRPLLALFVLLGVLAPNVAFAKRIPAPKVTPLVSDGVKYVAPNDNGRRAYVQAWDTKTNQMLWEVTVFRNAINPLLEEDVQWVFIKELRIKEGKLIVIAERDRAYSVDLKTHAVRRLTRVPPENSQADGIDDALSAAAREALPQLSTNIIFKALETGLWNSNKTALAIAIPSPKASVLFVFLQQRDGKYLAVDVSGMEGANFGHLGTAGRAAYERFETTPLKWLHREDDLFQIMMRTRAWKGGQRYTTSGTLVIKPEGTLIWQ